MLRVSAADARLRSGLPEGCGARVSLVFPKVLLNLFERVATFCDARACWRARPRWLADVFALARDCAQRVCFGLFLRLRACALFVLGLWKQVTNNGNVKHFVFKS